MRKRGIAVLLAVCMSAGVLAGCTGNTSAGNTSGAKIGAAAQEETQIQAETQTQAEAQTQAETQIQAEAQTQAAGATPTEDREGEEAVEYTGDQVELAKLLENFGDQEFIDAIY